MTIVTFPSERLASIVSTVDWAQQRNRSEFTSKSEGIGLPGHDLWLAKATIYPVATEGQARNWRWFLAATRGMINSFRIPILPSAQRTGVEPTIASSSDKWSIEVTSAAGFELGMPITVEQSDGHERLTIITGIAGTTIAFEPPLTGEADTGSTVHINNPWLLARHAQKSVGWSENMADFSGTLDLEEAI